MENCLNETNSSQSCYLIDIARKINIFSSLFILVIGLTGHTFTIVIFSQKRFRINSNNVFLLCLAVNDSLFLVIHFFEDTIRTFNDVYIANTNASHFVQIKTLIYYLNIVDKHTFTCRVINYLRYTLRFISAYIIVAFTIQRLIIVRSPLSDKFSSKKSAWKTVARIIVVSCLINILVPLLVRVQEREGNDYCDVDERLKKEYFNLTTIYIITIMLLPILIIFTSNFLIISQTIKSDVDRISNTRSMQGIPRSFSLHNIAQASSQNKFLDLRVKSLAGSNRELSEKNFKTKPYYLNVDQVTKKISYKSNNSFKITRMLILVSFMHAFLNLPYMIIWFLFYYKVILLNGDLVTRNYLFAKLQIFEILYMLNYGLQFYINYFSGSIFRTQFKFSSKFSI